MEKMKITEALAEVKLIEKKIESKKTFVVSNLTRVDGMPDPLGDGPKALESEMQSITDMQKRLVSIRAAITKANLAHSIKVNEQEKTIFDWLTWRREISAKHLTFLNQVHSSLKLKVDQSQNAPQAAKNDKGEMFLVRLLTNLSYPEMLQKAQELQAMLDKLDGQLSLKNATIEIEF